MKIAPPPARRERHAGSAPQPVRGRRAGNRRFVRFSRHPPVYIDERDMRSREQFVARYAVHLAERLEHQRRVREQKARIRYIGCEDLNDAR
jgi:hypothetical protein